MAKTQTFTKLSPAEATSEVSSVLDAAGLPGFHVSSSPQTIGRQGKVFLVTVASGNGDAAGALAVMRNLPDVCTANMMGSATAYIYRRTV